MRPRSRNEDVPESVTATNVTPSANLPTSGQMSFSEVNGEIIALWFSLTGEFIPAGSAGDLFSIEFIVEDDAPNGTVEIELTDQTAFSDSQGQSMYWGYEGTTIEVGLPEVYLSLNQILNETVGGIEGNSGGGEFDEYPTMGGKAFDSTRMAEALGYGELAGGNEEVAREMGAVKTIKDAGLIAVSNLSIKKGDKTRDGYTPEDACKILEDNGADVVGLNCFRGPKMTMKLLNKIREKVSCHVAGLPVPYRTTEKEPGFLNQTDPGCDCIPGGNAFPVALDNLYCNRFEMAEFAKECASKKINFIGICCGASPHHVREMAVALGRKPISYKYYPDMSKHYVHGSDKSLKKIYTDHAKEY